MNETRMEQIARLMKENGWRPCAVNITEMSVEYIRPGAARETSAVFYLEAIQEMTSAEFSGFMETFPFAEEESPQPDARFLMEGEDEYMDIPEYYDGPDELPGWLDLTGENGPDEYIA